MSAALQHEPALRRPHPGAQPPRLLPPFAAPTAGPEAGRAARPGRGPAADDVAQDAAASLGCAEAWPAFAELSRRMWTPGLGRVVLACVEGGRQRFLLDAHARLYRVLREGSGSDPWVVRAARDDEVRTLATAWQDGAVDLALARLQG